MDEHLDKLIDWHGALTDLAIRFGPKALVAILIMVLGGFVGRWVARMMLRGLSRFDLEPPVRQLLVRVVRVLVFGMFLIMALKRSATAFRFSRFSRILRRARGTSFMDEYSTGWAPQRNFPST